LHGG